MSRYSSIRLSEAADKILADYKDEHNISTMNAAFEQLINEYNRLANYKRDYATASIDINVQTLIEVVNTLLLNLHSKNILSMQTAVTTDVVTAPVLKQSQEHVKRSIAKKKQVKDNRASAKRGKL